MSFTHAECRNEHNELPQKQDSILLPMYLQGNVFLTLERESNCEALQALLISHKY